MVAECNPGQDGITFVCCFKFVERLLDEINFDADPGNQEKVPCQSHPEVEKFQNSGDPDVRQGGLWLLLGFSFRHNSNVLFLLQKSPGLPVTLLTKVEIHRCTSIL
jgi:hypothetical protein